MGNTLGRIYDIFKGKKDIVGYVNDRFRYNHRNRPTFGYFVLDLERIDEAEPVTYRRRSTQGGDFRKRRKGAEIGYIPWLL